VYRQLKRGQLPAFKVGSDWRFNVESIDRWRLEQDSFGAAGEHFDQDGNLGDPAVRASLVELVEALRAWTLRIDLGRAAA